MSPPILICIYKHIYINTYSHTHTHMCVYIHTHSHTLLYICMPTHSLKHLACLATLMSWNSLWMRVYIYIYIYIYTSYKLTRWHEFRSWTNPLCISMCTRTVGKYVSNNSLANYGQIFRKTELFNLDTANDQSDWKLWI